MDQWRTLLLQAKGKSFLPGSMGINLWKAFDPGTVATFGGTSGQVVSFGGALYRVPEGLHHGPDVTQYEAAFAHLHELLPAFRVAGATQFILHMRRTCRGLCNEEFTRSELKLLASLDCDLFYAAREGWQDDA
jgi:hypothetical protein